MLSTSVFQILNTFANREGHHTSQKSARKPQTEARGSRMWSFICYPLLPRYPSLACIPTADFQQLLLRTRISSPSPLLFCLRMRFSPDLARGLSRRRRCGRNEDVERMWIAIGWHFTFPELSGRRAKAEGVWRAAPGANMPRYAQLVMGPAGSGKVRI